MALHTFQPLPADSLDLNPFVKIGKEWALLSAGNKQKANTMTVSWGGLGVLWGKNVVSVYVRDSRYTKEFIDNGDFFSLAFFGDTCRTALEYCGKFSGRNDNKFKSAGLTPAFKLSIPYPDEANLVILCKKMAAVPITEDTFIDKEIKEKFYSDGDMHTMYVGEVLEIMAR